MKLRMMLVTGLALLLAACGGGDATPVPPANPIEWDRNPNTIVFRADVTGGSQNAFLRRGEVPLCTVYGDNRVVWANELGAFNTQVLWDQVSDDAIRQFVSQLVINNQFYNFQARANLEPASAVEPVVETLTLFVNNDLHETDAFSGWDMDYYERVVNSCKAISQAPIIYEPGGGWVSAQVVDYDPSVPALLWDGAANNLVLAEVAASSGPRWITGRTLVVLWTQLRTSPPNIQFNENNIQYQVVVQVPNVTRDAPPAPAS